jgi:zinc transporter 2
LSIVNESENYNLRAAMIHVLGDILQSIGVLIAALFIYFLGKKEDEGGNIIWSNWQYADPCCTYLFSILVLFTTFGVAKSCIKVLMEGTPEGLFIYYSYEYRN